ncbi:hypothetical protein [Zunongwangia sp. H14]|uniref:hypothetical protein n=1 Tax=Zunongwangia sp. H14 TaxID=3240792 RepID=UPI0035649F7A
MNYIKHLTGVFERFNEDQRLNPSHVSIYYALFQYWNVFRFRKQFFVQREEIMQASKVGSLSTYHKCIRELSEWNYILYMPSKNPLKGSQVKMSIFWTCDEQVEDEHAISDGQEPDKFETFLEQVAEEYGKSGERARVYETNNIKYNKPIKPLWPKSEFEVIEFFKIKTWPETEASNFYLHYEALGWKIGGNQDVVNWKALAQRWMKKAEEIQKQQKLKNPDHLKIQNFKNYGEPL